MSPTSNAVAAGLDVLGEVAGYLSAALHVEDALAGVADVLQRGLQVRECRIWLRSPGGEAYRAARPLGAPDPPSGLEGQVAQWVARSEAPAWTPDEPWLRLPLKHQGEHLGLLECIPEKSNLLSRKDSIAGSLRGRSAEEWDGRLGI